MARQEKAIFVESMTKNDKMRYGRRVRNAKFCNCNNLEKNVCGTKIAVIHNKIKVCIESTYE
jgi:hypothetical protein